MANLAWPSDLGYATVEGRVLYLEGDSSDQDRDPDLIPASGTVYLEPSVNSVRYGGVNGPSIMVKRMTKGVLDSEGYLCTPGPDGVSPGERGLVVPATDSDNISPTNFTYRVTISAGSWQSKFSIHAPAGTTVDLAKAVPVAESGGTAYVVDESIAVRAESAASYVENVVDNVDQVISDYLASNPDLKGEKGKDGEVGPTGYAVGVNVERIEKGALSISGPSVARLERGTVVIRNSAQSGLPPWSINSLALMAGRSISSLWYDSVDNMIYSGYGDWTANGDEIGVVRHSVLTGDAEVVYFPENGQSEYQPTFRRRGAWTEAIESFYRFGDAIYIPHIDGAGYWEGCGYITNEGGQWHEVSLPGQCLHLFAMAQTSEGLWAAGSSIYASQADAGAMLWFRPTGGAWQIHHQANAKGMGFSRFYQIHVKDDRAWVHDSATMGQDVYGFNATDMVSRKKKTDETWNRNVTDQITVGDYTYRGGPMGKITKERKR